MNYIFSDFWLDDEVELTGEVSNYTQPAQWKGDEVARLPIFEQTVIFKVSAPRLHENEALGLLGNHPTLGEWNTDHYLPMTHLKGDDWVLSVRDPRRLMRRNTGEALVELLFEGNDGTDYKAEWQS